MQWNNLIIIFKSLYFDLEIFITKREWTKLEFYKSLIDFSSYENYEKVMKEILVTKIQLYVLIKFEISFIYQKSKIICILIRIFNINGKD